MKNLLAVLSIVGILFLAFSVNSNAVTKTNITDEVVLKIDDTIVSNTGCKSSCQKTCEKKCSSTTETATTDTTKSCCKKDATKCETEGTKCKSAKKTKCEKKCNSEKSE